MNPTIVIYYFATAYEGGYMELNAEDGSPLREPSREKLMARLDEAQEAAGELAVYVVKETLETEELIDDEKGLEDVRDVFRLTPAYLIKKPKGREK